MTLRPLVVCVGLIALLMGGAASAKPRTASEAARPAAERSRGAVSMEAQLTSERAARRRHRGTIRFFENRPELLRSPKHRSVARSAIRRAKRGLARATQAIERIRVVLEARAARRLHALPPRKAICHVFRSYCGQALNVAWCESRFRTTARNGQYLGLFQMGSSERRLFGHGPTAYEQSRAAHKYFVLSGRDWSPWGCRWAAV